MHNKSTACGVQNDLNFGLRTCRLRGGPRATQEAFLSAINTPGDIFLIHTELSGLYTIRLAVGSTGTQLRHMQEAWTAISAAADKVIKEHGLVTGDATTSDMPAEL